MQVVVPKRIVAPSGDQVGDSSKSPEHVEEEATGVLIRCSPLPSAFTNTDLEVEPLAAEPGTRVRHEYAILLPSGEIAAGDQYLDLAAVIRRTGLAVREPTE